MDDLHRNRRTVPHGRPGSERRHQSRPQAGRAERLRGVSLSRGLKTGFQPTCIRWKSSSHRLPAEHHTRVPHVAGGQALSEREKRQAYVMFTQNGKAGYC